jgi:hypothetical protein
MANLPYDISTNPTYRGVQVMRDTVTAVARGEIMGTIIGGGTGIGKTFLVHQICRKAGIKEVPDERPTSLDALVSFFWLYRAYPVGLLDECDHLLRQQTTINLLKGANGDPRVVTHGAKQSVLNKQYLAEDSRRYRDYIPPTKFLLGNLLRQIMLTNKNYQDPRVIAELPIAHWNALVGRGIDVIWIPTDGRDGLDLFEYTHHTATEGGMLRSLQFTWEVSQRAVRFYVENIHFLVDIHPRRLVMIAQTIKDNPDPDKHMARLSQMLRDSDQRPKLIIPRTWVAMNGGLLLPNDPPPPKHRLRGTQRPAVATRKPEVPEPPAASQPELSATGSDPSQPTPRYDPPEPAPTNIPVRIEPRGACNATPDPGPDPKPQPHPTTDRPGGPESPVDLNDGYKTLDDNTCVSYFGIPCKAPPHPVPRVLAVRSVLAERVGTRDIGAWIEAGFAMTQNNQTLFNVAAIRAVVDDAKAQLARAEVDGFKIADPPDFGARNHSEAHDLMLRAFGLESVVNSLKPLLDGGYLRIIAGMRLYQLDKMRALMEQGRAAQKPPNPVPSSPINTP